MEQGTVELLVVWDAVIMPSQMTGNSIVYSVKQLNYSMRQSVKLVQPQRKTTTVGLKTVSYFGTKLWNDNDVLCNKLWNEDFLTFKRNVNDPNLDIITHDDFQYSWNRTSAPLMHISFVAFFIVFFLFGGVQVSIFVFYDWIMKDFVRQFQRPFIEFRIYSKLVANVLRIFLCFVYICFCTVYIVCTLVVY